MVDLRRAPHDVAPPRYYGKYRGRVADNKDPNNMGRIQVEVPAILSAEPLGWAMPCVPFAGDGIGLYLIPEVDSMVWVEFEYGDPKCPIWTGCFWVKGQLPEEAKPGVFLLKTKSGNILKLSDGDKTIEITRKDGPIITMTDDTITIDSGSNKIVVNGSAVTVNDGSLEVT